MKHNTPAHAMQCAKILREIMNDPEFTTSRANFARLSGALAHAEAIERALMEEVK